MAPPFKSADSVLSDLMETLAARRGADPASSYTASLLDGGVNRIGKKIGEEAAETLLASKDPDDEALTHELADLWFHCMVLMTHRGLPLTALTDELARRMNQSGLTEKASRPTE